MGDDKTYDEPSEVLAKDGDVVVDGPDGVDVKFTPNAAVETSDRLLEAGAEAQGQRLRQKVTSVPDDLARQRLNREDAGNDASD